MARGGAHQGQARPHAGHSRWNGRCSNGWREQVLASGARHDISCDCDALQGAPGDDRWQVADIDSTNDFYRVATSGATTSPIRGSGLRRQVTTATPFAPHGAGHQEGRRESSVDTRHHAASRRRRRNSRISLELAGGVVAALDAAPFSDRRGQASYTRG